MGEHTTKQERIMQAATKLFATKGFHAVTVPKVAKAAGVASGTLYHYFDSKEDLVNAIYIRHKRALIHAVTHEFPHELPPRSRFREMFYRFAHFANQHPVEHAFLHFNNHTAYLSKSGDVLDGELLNWLHAFITRMIQEESVKPLAPNLFIALVGGVIEGIAKQCNLGRIPLTDHNLVALETMAWDAVRR